MPTRRHTRTVSLLATAVAVFAVVLPANAAPAPPAPASGAEQIAQARKDLEALNTRVDLAVEEYDLGTIALAKAQKQSALAQARVDRSKERLAALQQDFGTVASAAYRSGSASDFVSLVTTSSPQTFLDKASALDHISRSKQEQIQFLRAANRDLRAVDAANDLAVANQRAVAARLEKTRTAIASDVAEQEKLLKRLETDEAKRIAAAREAERKRLIALAAARAEKARLAKIEAARLARLAAAEQARLEKQGRERQAARVAKLREQRAVEEQQAQREADAAAADAAAAITAASDPAPAVDAPPQPQPEPANTGGSDRAAIAVRTAYQQLGKPYRWAADGPGSFDCSGLMLYAWARAGVSLPHSSRAQYGEGTHVGRGDLRPGDLVFFGSPIHHVGMYVGGGSYIAAPQTGDVVSVRSMGRGDYVGAVRL